MPDNLTTTAGILATHDVGGGIHKQKVETSSEQPAATTGSITTSTTAVTAAATNYGQATVVVFGTYAGVSFVFEVSADGGTTYFPLQIAREADGAVLLGDTPATNGTVGYIADLPGGVTNFRVRATAFTSGSASIVIAPAAGPVMPVVSIGNTGGATGASSTVAGSATAVTLKAANNGRRGLTLFNDSSSACFVLLGAGTVSATVFSVKMSAGTYYEVPFGFTGIVTGIWVTATGSMRVTELTA